VAPEKKLRLGHSTVAWFEADVWAWLEAQRVA
jgi:predicted DNA-binding transcriptional regulator AlpA